MYDSLLKFIISFFHSFIFSNHIILVRVSITGHHVHKHPHLLKLMFMTTYVFLDDGRKSKNLEETRLILSY